MKMSDYLKNIEDNNVSYWLYVRENLKPNDYVKLNTGEITRSINVSPIRGNKIYYANGDDCWFDISAVRNFSPNIIDLIEEGDILKVNDFKDVYTIYEVEMFRNPYTNEKYLGIRNDIGKKPKRLYEIPLVNLSIVTKESMESVTYYVK